MVIGDLDERTATIDGIEHGLATLDRITALAIDHEWESLSCFVPRQTQTDKDGDGELSMGPFPLSSVHWHLVRHHIFRYWHNGRAR
jgi:hypothetical protein